MTPSLLLSLASLVITLLIAAFGSLVGVTFKLSRAVRDLEMATERIKALESRLEIINVLERRLALSEQRIDTVVEWIDRLQARMDRTDRPAHHST